MEVVADSRSGVADNATQPKLVGTVQMLSQNETVLVPTPSPDPKGKSYTELRGERETLVSRSEYQDS